MGEKILNVTLPDGVTFAQRYGRIIQACRKARIDVLCKAHEWSTGMKTVDMEQLIHERLWGLWNDEWDNTDYPYGGEGDETAWTVPKFCHNVAAKVIKETERDNRIKGVTQSPRVTSTGSMFQVAHAETEDLERLYRPDGTQAYILLLLPDTDNTRRMVELNIANQLDPDHDPDTVYMGAERAARAIIQQLRARTGEVETARILDQLESGRDGRLTDRMRNCLFRVYYGDASGLHELTAGIDGKPVRKPARRHNSRRNTSKVH